MSLLRWGIEQLAQDIPLPLNWKDHQLKGNMKGLREYHIGGQVIGNLFMKNGKPK